MNALDRVDAILKYSDRNLRVQFLTGFKLGYDIMREYKPRIDLGSSDFKVLFRIPEFFDQKKSELESRKANEPGRAIGTLIGIIEFHPQALLDRTYIEQILIWLKILYNNDWFRFYIHSYMQEWDVKMMQTRLLLTGRQQNVYMEFHPYLTLRKQL